ncbi:MAG TPA: transglycosylase family protein [Acidimicrobiales bacterium]|nr:transglycosylase family protein [Acidimicrobiales bacterium]
MACAMAPLAFGAPAGGDQIGNLRDQAAQLSRQITLEQLQIGGYQQQYAAAVAKSAQDQQLVVQTEAAIAADQQRIGQDTGQLRHDAVAAYVEAGTTGTGLFDNQASAGARSEYGRAMAGDISVTIDQLHDDQRSLQVQQAARQKAVDDDQDAQADARTLLSRSESVQTQLESQSAEVTGQLATAVAQQQAAQAQAAAAAVRQAQARATKAPSQSTEIVVGNPAPTVASSGTDPALNPFLECVVQHESGGNYQIASPTGQYMGAFQFSQSTWNVAARLAGRPTLVGVPPDRASKADQDTLAVALYSADGEQPWYDPCNSAHG